MLDLDNLEKEFLEVKDDITNKLKLSNTAVLKAIELVDQSSLNVYYKKRLLNIIFNRNNNPSHGDDPYQKIYDIYEENGWSTSSIGC